MFPPVAFSPLACQTMPQLWRSRLSGGFLAFALMPLLFVGCNADRPDNEDVKSANAASSLAARDTALVFSPDMIDFGASKHHEFRFPLSIHNRSEAPIRIGGLDRSCGCTAVNMTLPYTVPAGGTIQTVIEFAYSEHSCGVIAQHIKLRTDDPHNPIYQIPIRGILEGKPEVILSPEIVHFGMVGGWEAPSSEVRLRYSGRTDLEVKSILASDPHLTAVFSRKEIDGALLYRVILRKGFRLGLFREYIEFATNHGNARLGIEGEQERDLYVCPAFLHCRGKQFPAKRILVLRHSPEHAPTLAAAHSDTFQVTLESVSTKSPGVTRLALSLRPKISRVPEEGTIHLVLREREEPLAIKIYISE